MGYAISDEDVTVGIASVGAPIFDSTGGAAAAISVGGLTALVLGDQRRDQVIELVTSGARRISQALGYRPAEPSRTAAR